MALEQFNVRRIRDGVTYNTNMSEILAYAEGASEETGASRWRAGLFRAQNGVYFAVREESRRYFDQIAGRWAEGAHVTLDVVDYAAALKWCETHDANILVDFTIDEAAKATAGEKVVVEDVVAETAAEPVVEAAPAEEPVIEAVAETAPAEPAVVEAPVVIEEPSAVTLSISGDQKTAIELEAQKAGMTLDAYLLYCVEVSRAAHVASLAHDAAGSQEISEPETLSDPAAEAELDECIEQTLIEVELEEAAPQLVACHDFEPMPVEDQLALIEVMPVAVCETGALVLTVAEENEADTAAHEASGGAQIVPMSPEMLHHQQLAQRAALVRQLVNEQAELGQAAE